MMERVASLKDPYWLRQKQALAALLGREVLGEDLGGHLHSDDPRHAVGPGEGQ